MTRSSTLPIVVLSLVVLAQAWLLHGRGASPARIAAAAGGAETAGSAEPAAPDADPVAVAVMARLDRIDARLAALDDARVAAGPAVVPPASRSEPPSSDRIDPRTIADADRRLAALLPDRDIDRGAWARWQAALASLPAEERFALSAAFARAVNEDRLRWRP
ncbi:MAG: hypothetical protein JF600_03360 [Xanthomonadales bacterium]|nr:hypothetical protein [Xanthomonadales bacterium]